LWEGLPYVFLEAGHYKKPVIATGTYDHIPLNKYFGFVTIPIKKHQIIANKVLEVLRDKVKVKALGEKTFKVVTKKYSFKRFVEQHQLLYLEN
jgi:glycosyltransferase involved in cell wall biosynthesis